MWLETLRSPDFILFPIQLMICEAGFLFKKLRREQFPLRLLLSIFISLLVDSVVASVFHALGEEHIAFYIPMYLGFAAATVIPLWYSFELKGLELLFIVVGGYAVQHMIYALLRIVLYAMTGTPETSGWMQLVTQYGGYLLGACMIYLILIRKNEDKSGFSQEDSRIVIYGFVLILVAVVLSVFFSYPVDSLNFYSCILCPAYSFTSCALVLVMDYYVLRENRMKREAEIMEQMLQMASSQQRSSKEAIDIIHMKCHDLRHQLKVLVSIDDPASRSVYLQEVQQAVNIYDATYHTGCEVLDYILQEKTLLFREYQVAFSCMADGALISHMLPTDVYALLGNALDNATECVLQEQEEERVVSLHIVAHQDMVLIHLENRCSTAPQFQDGLPLTTKPDRSVHGFGVRSIRYITEKYGGELYMSAKDGKFFVDVLLPRQIQAS